MICSVCTNPNPEENLFCDVCGAELRRQRGTEAEVERMPLGPHQKRRTVVDLGANSGRPSVDADIFGNPPPPRPPMDPSDPFRQAVKGAAPIGAQPARGLPQAPGRNATVVSVESPESVQLRGVLFDFKTPGDPGTVHRLVAGRNTVGRDATNQVVLDDNRVSAQHAMVYLDERGARFLDISRNGSRVDGQLVFGSQVDVKNGSVMEVGASRLVLVLLPVDPASLWDKA